LDQIQQEIQNIPDELKYSDGSVSQSFFHTSLPRYILMRNLPKLFENLVAARKAKNPKVSLKTIQDTIIEETSPEILRAMNIAGINKENYIRSVLS
jgi:hypothetical protein